MYIHCVYCTYLYAGDGGHAEIEGTGNVLSNLVGRLEERESANDSTGIL